MHKALFVMTFSLCLGCSGGTKTEDYGRLSKDESERLIEINQLQADMATARDQAFGSLIAPAAADRKAEMKIALDLNCVDPAVDIPDNDMTGVAYDQRIQGPACPVNWMRYRFFNTSGRVYVANEILTVTDPGFREMSGTFSRQINLRIEAQRQGVTRVTGDTAMGFSIVLANHGQIGGGIKTEGQYSGGASGKGYASVTLTGKGWSHTGMITWELPKFEPKFHVDGEPISRKGFDEMFSSYDLVKIMDNSLQMR